MARRIQPGGTPKTTKSNSSKLGKFVRSFFGKVFLLVFVGALILIGIPLFAYGTHLGGNIMPGVTQFFTKLSAPPAPATPTPLPPLSPVLPQPGSVLYTVQDGDSCVSILAFGMHMNAAGNVFSDAKPETVTALNAALGQDCHKLQPGMVLPLSPQYPLTSLGGVVLKIDALSTEQVLPTPLIQVQGSNNQPTGPDCSEGCKLTVRLNAQTQIFLSVKTDLIINVGSWVWAQAMLPRKPVAGFANYPYADSNLSFNGATFQACDLQVDNKHDDQSTACQDLSPNTIVADEGAWLLGVTGRGALDHWNYPLKVSSGTRVLLWLSLDHGNLVFKSGNSAYRYNETTHIYEKL